METSSFLSKAQENLQAAQLCLHNGLYNASADRAYYAMLQAAVVILKLKGFDPKPKHHFDHGLIQSMFASELIIRRKIIESKFSSYLSDAQIVRATADYETTSVSQKKANRQLSKAKEFVDAIKKEMDRA